MFNRFYRLYAKRALDVTVSACLLLLLSPVLLLLAVAVRLCLGRPVLYHHSRPGLHGQRFTLRKFRSMTDARDSEGNLLSDEHRLTRFGQMLRRTSLDELPGLWNVLRGDMSLVGPRPLLVEYLGRYSSEQARRHDVRPGITGWAQIHGRNAISWEEKFLYDSEYVRRHSFLMDVRIMVQTLWTVCARRGIHAKEHVTMPPFLGTSHLGHRSAS